MAAAAVLLVGILAFAALRDGADQTAADPGTNDSSTSEPSPSAEPTSPSPESPTTEESPTQEAPSPAATEQAMSDFVTSYLSTVTSDPRSTFEMLTPQFQQQSNGYGGYSGFWGTVESATPRDVTADPKALTVSYTVDYVMTNGRQSTQDVTLQLAREGTAS